jgi:hypothetical protein
LTLSGTAVSESVLSLPTASKSKVESKYEAQQDLVMSSGQPSFFQVDGKTMEAKLPEFESKADTINILLTMQAVKDGNVSLDIKVEPISDPEKAVNVSVPVAVKTMRGVLTNW